MAAGLKVVEALTEGDPGLDAEGWRTRLDHQLTERIERITLYSDYYNGDHRLSFATNKYKEAFGDLFEAFATNWCGLVVDVAVERLKVQGFRFGVAEADEDAWKIWQANRLDAQSIMGHTEAIKCENAYLIIGPPAVHGREPVITVESPFQVITEHDPTDRTKRLAALKKYRDWNGDTVSVVYLPDETVEFRRKAHADNLVQVMGVWLPFTFDPGDWDEITREPNPLGIVPVVPLENSPSLEGGGTSDLRPAVGLNDAANKFFVDMIHASEFTSFPQRVLTGVEIPKDPVTGEPSDAAQLRAAVARMWTFESPDTKVYDLAAGDLGNYVQGVDMAVQHLAAQTKTPPHYLLAKLANISGDALKAAETGLVARCRRKHIDFSDTWEEVMRLAFGWRALDRRQMGMTEEANLDQARSEMDDAETLWADPESRNPAAIGDGLIKKQQIGVPWEALMDEAGYSPQQIKRMKAQRKAEQEAAATLAANAAAPQTPVDAAGANLRTYAGGKPIVVATTDRGVEITGLPGPDTEVVAPAGAPTPKPDQTTPKKAPKDDA